LFRDGDGIIPDIEEIPLKMPEMNDVLSSSTSQYVSSSIPFLKWKGINRDRVFALAAFGEIFMISRALSLRRIIENSFDFKKCDISLKMHHPSSRFSIEPDVHDVSLVKYVIYIIDHGITQQ
jgi:hypothetical protein